MGVNQVTDGAGNAVTLERVDALYQFLQGADFEGIGNLGRSRPRLSRRSAQAVIYVLQEGMDLIPDRFENCTRCGVLFDAEQEGDATSDRPRCDSCVTYMRR